MEKVWNFDNNYFLTAIKKIDEIISSKNLSREQVELLQEDKLYFYACLDDKPIIKEEIMTLAEALEKIEKKMRLELKKIGIQNISYIYHIVSFIARQRNETESTFTEKADNRNEVINKSLNFYGNLDHDFYNIINQLLNCKTILYNFNEDPKTIDECVWVNYNKLPIVNIYDTKNVLVYSKLVHEMQHQIDNVINANKYSNYSGFKHFLRECSAIFSELVYCDSSQKENPNSIDINSLYLERINNIDSLSVNLKGYLDIMLLLDDPDYHLDFDNFIDIIEHSFFNISENYLLEYVKNLLEYKANEKIKYLFSYLVALDVRTIYQTNPKEAMSIIKYIINLELYDYDFDSLKKKGINLDIYQSGAYNHIKHTMEVESKRLSLITNMHR